MIPGSKFHPTWSHVQDNSWIIGPCTLRFSLALSSCKIKINETYKKLFDPIEETIKFFIAKIFSVVVYKTLNHVGTIKLTKNHKSERRRVEQQIYSEESRIISDNVDYEETASFIQKPCPTSGSDLESSTNAGDNDREL